MFSTPKQVKHNVVWVTVAISERLKKIEYGKWSTLMM